MITASIPHTTPRVILRRFARPLALFLFTFLLSILSACSFDQLPIGQMKPVFLEVATTLGCLASCAAYYLDMAAVIGVMAVAFTSVYAAYRMEPSHMHVFTLACLVGSSVGLLLQQGKQLLAWAITIAALLGLAILLRHSLPFVPIAYLAVLIVTSASYMAACIASRVTQDLEPHLSYFAAYSRQIASFLGVYVAIGIVFALIYDNLYLYNHLFFVTETHSVPRLDLGYFIYWSFSVFLAYGVGELMPATMLVRALVIIQMLCGITWMTIFLAFFASGLIRQGIERNSQR